MNKIQARCTIGYCLFFTTLLSLFVSPWVQAQQFSLLDVNTSRFPIISARVYPFTAEGKRVDSLVASAVVVRDNGLPCSVEQVLCTPTLPSSVGHSLLMAFDISSSTQVFSEHRVLEEYAIKHFATQVNNKSIAEAAITVFDNSSYVAHDFTNNPAELSGVLSSVQRLSGTNYRHAFLEAGSGALALLAKAKHKGSMVFVTDGIDEIDTAEILQKARLLNADIYCIMLGNVMPQHLKDLATASGGAWFERVNDTIAMHRVCNTIGGLIAGEVPCEVSWRVANPCDSIHHVDIEIPSLRTTHGFDYTIPEEKVATLRSSAANMSFGSVQGGKTSEATIELRAINYPLSIDSVSLTGMPFFTCELPFRANLGAGDKKVLRVRYAPKDSSFAWAKLHVYSSSCKDLEITLAGGFPGVKPSIKTLRVLQPNGREILSSFSSTIILWEGSSPEDDHLLELSSDGGKTWNIIRDRVKGNSYTWNVPEVTSDKCLIRVSQHGAEENNRGIMQTDQSDNPFSIIPISAAVREINMQQAIVNIRKDSVIRTYISNPASAPELKVQNIRIDGEQAPEFGIASMVPPFSLKPGESREIEFFFKPAAAGLREARVVVGTNYGYRTHRIYGYGIIPQIIMAEPIDMGNVAIGDSALVIAPIVISNKTNKNLNVSHIVTLGPDTSQFSIAERFMPFSLKPGESYSLALQFKPTHEGRSSTRFGFVTGEFGSPHVLTVFGKSGEDDAVYNDVTSHRGIAIPNGIVPKAGTVTLGVYDLLGLTATYSITDNIMIIAGGVLPLPLNKQTSQVLSGGLKFGTHVSDKFSVGAGYQFASSSYDKSETTEKESAITMHIPYGVATYGNDSARVSLMMGYALKHHVTSTSPEGFDANALLVALSVDYRIATRWKLCTEAYSFETLGYVPLVTTARYLGKSYSIDAGVAFTGITTGSTKAPSFPFLPVLSCVWSW